MTVKLNNYKNILTYEPETGHEFVRTLFKYGFIMKNEIAFVCLFKYNNHRLEWITHIDYCIQNKVNSLSLETELKQNDSHDINPSYTQSIKLLMSALNVYNELLKNTSNQSGNGALNYRNILNCFHCVIKEQHKNDKHEINYECSCAYNECEYIQRHKRRNLNKLDHQNILFQLLDHIHCYLCHTQQNQLVRDDISKRFLIETQLEEHDGNSDDDKKDDTDTYTMKGDVMFAFGLDFNYYQSTHCYYIIPQFSCLKEELVSNPYHKLPESKYYTIYEKAVQFIKANAVKSIKARDVGLINKNFGIPVDTPITINHIISLLIYCNETEIQNIYKRHTRKTSSDEPLKKLYHRQSFIAHWNRYLMEACFVYGQVLNNKDYVYCGVDRKLIFNSFCFHIYCPLSTSSELIVANNFATNKGIIVKMKATNELNDTAAYFDMMILSDYVNEKKK
eukprot:13113_1